LETSLLLLNPEIVDEIKEGKFNLVLIVVVFSNGAAFFMN
jgi:hypothetical protein